MKYIFKNSGSLYSCQQIVPSCDCMILTDKCCRHALLLYEGFNLVIFYGLHCFYCVKPLRTELYVYTVEHGYIRIIV